MESGERARAVPPTCQEAVEAVCEARPGAAVGDVVADLQPSLPVHVRPQGHPWGESATVSRGALPRGVQPCTEWLEASPAWETGAGWAQGRASPGKEATARLPMETRGL